MAWGVPVEGLCYPTIHSFYDERQTESWNDVSGYCTAPVKVPLIHRNGGETDLVRYVGCRKCPGCLLQRQRQWMRRATAEYMVAERTWWLTLTYSGSEAPDYEAVKLFFKRLRKRRGAFRYVVSEELGETHERLHWHVLIHCTAGLRRRDLDAAWPHGFVHARLAKTAGLGSYLAKYLAKQSRIRASVLYGGEPTIATLLSTESELTDDYHSIKAGHAPSGALPLAWLSLKRGINPPIRDIIELGHRYRRFKFGKPSTRVIDPPF